MPVTWLPNRLHLKKPSARFHKDPLEIAFNMWTFKERSATTFIVFYAAVTLQMLKVVCDEQTHTWLIFLKVGKSKLEGTSWGQDSLASFHGRKWKGKTTPV